MTLALQQARALYGLSRGSQAALSVAQPLVAALLADDSPAALRLAVLTITAFAGLLAVFAVNDVLDAPLDLRRRAVECGHRAQGRDIDSAGVLHPLAHGLLSRHLALAWVAAVGGLALIGCALLGWRCVAVLGAAVLLQVTYCKLATVTHWKALISGVMVAVGTSAGWFAFTGSIDPLRLGLFALWMAAWEVGGRNIPNDLADMDEDRPLGIRTLPVVHGPQRSARIALACLAAAGAASTALALAASDALGALGIIGTALTATLTLIVPGLHLVRRPTPTTALRVFNIASFQPACVLLVITTAALVTT
jgi:4-hydroxybenzoate polyprenyltransferase